MARRSARQRQKSSRNGSSPIRPVPLQTSVEPGIPNLINDITGETSSHPTGSLRVQTTHEPPDSMTAANARPSVVTPESGSQNTSSFRDPSSLTAREFIEGRLKKIVDPATNAQDSCFDTWLTQDNFIHLIETFGGPHTSWNGTQATPVDLATNLIKDVRKLSLAVELTGSSDVDEALLGNSMIRVYFHQVKANRGKRYKFFFVSSANNVDPVIRPPTSEDAKSLISQPIIDFTEGQHNHIKDWWLSNSANALFDPYGENTDAYCAVLSTIDLISTALAKGGDVLSLVEGFNRKDASKQFNAKDLESLRVDIYERCVYIRAALLEAAKVDGEQSTLKWEDCIAQSTKNMAAIGFTRTKGSSQVRAWYQMFRDKTARSTSRRFPNFLEFRKTGPLLFVHHPELKLRLSQYVNNNLEDVSAEKLRDVLLTEIIPSYIDDNELEIDNTEGEEFDDTDLPAGVEDKVPQFLRSCGLSNLSETTCRKMMHWLGCEYDDHKKCFYNNTHEAHIEARIKYVWQYLEDEKRAPHYVRVRQAYAEKLKQEDKLAQGFDGHPFEKDGEAWLEFHVDDCEEFWDLWKHAPLEEKFSVRLDDQVKRVMFLGQDESVQAQFEFSKKAWRGTEGQQAMRPKGKGKGMMVCGTPGRVNGWDPKMSVEHLNQINANRQGKHYLDRDSALEVNSQTEKPLLTMETLPWVKFVEFGANSEGWWTGANMHLLVEDIGDCTSVLYPGIEQILFVDWSQGHARKRLDGLKVSEMNKNYGGAREIFHDSSISSGSFGDFENVGMLIKPADGAAVIQRFFFVEGDEGPCWMSPAERLRSKEGYEVEGEVRKIYLKKDALKARLQADLPSGTIPAGFHSRSHPKLVELAKERSINHWDEVPKVQPGWLGAPKGLLQVCYERGLVDGVTYTGRNLWKQYSVKGKKDAEGNTIVGSSLTELLDNCDDFKNEMTMLQYIGTKCGITVTMSPKCHCEIAGESIETIWGIGKMRFRRIPLSRRKSMEDFRLRVRETFSRDGIGDYQLRGSFRMHRAFMLAYYHLHREQAEKAAGDNSTILFTADQVATHATSIGYESIMKNMGKYKSHLSICEMFGPEVRKLADGPHET